MTSAASKALIYRYYEEVWNQRNLAVLDEIIDLHHVRYETGTVRELVGPDGVKQFIQVFIAAFPDLHFSLEDVVAEGDRVAARWVFQGTHDGYLRDIPPSGHSVMIPGISFARVANNKFVEYWTSWDAFLLLNEIGAFDLDSSIENDQE
ncbi:MAG TPA: ester cyclase [Crinalium sp.]|jgi:predicted ester cyclase